VSLHVVSTAWVLKSGLVMAGVLASFVCGVPPVVAALVGASLMLLTRAVNPKRLQKETTSPTRGASASTGRRRAPAACGGGRVAFHIGKIG
jgi:Na+/H+ antiporter NhaD/arsenite permease-like protein